MLTKLLGRIFRGDRGWKLPLHDDISLDREDDLEALCGLLREFEGLRLEPYLCSGGRWTIGYGSTRTGGGRPVAAATRPITKDTADRLLRRDAEATYRRVEKFLRPDASHSAKVAFSSLAYNMGWPRIKKSKAVRFYNRGDLARAEKHFKQWRLAGGKISAGLERRRAAEWKFISRIEGDG